MIKINNYDDDDWRIWKYFSVSVSWFVVVVVGDDKLQSTRLKFGQKNQKIHKLIKTKTQKNAKMQDNNDDY